MLPWGPRQEIRGGTQILEKVEDEAAAKDMTRKSNQKAELTRTTARGIVKKRSSTQDRKTPCYNGTNFMK